MRGLHRRAERRKRGQFVVEGPQGVREAVLCRADAVVEVFATAEAIDRHPDIADAAGDRVVLVPDEVLSVMTETVAPQGLLAVCRPVDVPLRHLLDPLGAHPRLIAVLAEAQDPGNAGTILRTADAAGADGVVFCAGSVDPYNGKAVRASAGSLFHVPLVTGVHPAEIAMAARSAGLQVLAADGAGASDLDDLLDRGDLAAPTAWVFGNEARGLSVETRSLADRVVRIPIHGRAESLNVAIAAAVALYASARAQR